MAYTEHQIIHERGDRHLNTDTYQSALESTKDSIEDVNKAIGFSLGSLTLEKLITSAITLVICIVCIWIIMRIARRISSHSRLSESLSRLHSQGAQDHAGIHGDPHRGRQPRL